MPRPRGGHAHAGVVYHRVLRLVHDNCAPHKVVSNPIMSACRRLCRNRRN